MTQANIDAVENLIQMVEKTRDEIESWIRLVNGRADQCNQFAAQSLSVLVDMQVSLNETKSELESITSDKS